MVRLVVGFVIGYVLGAKAGRERYEQIARLTSKVADSPAIQGAAGAVRAKITNLLPGRKSQAPTRPDAAYLDNPTIPGPGGAPVIVTAERPVR